MSDEPLDTENPQCPHCDESWDSTMNRPALKEFGHNPKSGTLYNCRACHSTVTQDELDTGKTTSELVEEGRYD